MMNPIYLDNNSTTPMLPAVWEAMQPYVFEGAGNPASSHGFGRRARQALEDARERVAALLDAHPDEVIFTSGATEANNLALLGLRANPPGTIVSSSMEHPSVSEPLAHRFQQGFTHLGLPVTPLGSVDAEAAVFPENVRLVAVMLANHETGAIQPVERLAKRLQGKAPFHCDAAAAAGKIPISVSQLGVTSLTLSAHKFHGPQGIGALILRRESKMQPLLRGGHQQQGRRPGTEPVPLAVGLAEALAWSVETMKENHAKLLALRSRFLAYLREHAQPIVLNGPEEGGLPHTLNLSFPACRADSLLMKLDLAGIACSTGSACSSGSLLPSPVLRAMGRPDAALRSALRFSLSPLEAPATIDEAARRILHCVKKLRSSPDADFPVQVS